MQINVMDIFWITLAVGLAITFASSVGVFSTEYMTGYDSSLYDQEDISTIVKSDSEGIAKVFDTLSLYVSMFLTAWSIFGEMIFAVLIYFPDMTTKFGIPEAVAPLITTGVWVVIIFSIIKFISNRFVGGGE